MAGEEIRLGSVSLDCADPHELAGFYSRMLQIDVAYDAGSFAAIQLEKIWLTFQRVSEYRAPTWPDPAVLQQIHLDFAVSDLVLGESLALAAGATKMQVQPNPERWLVFMDPAGHPFCLSTLIPG